MRFFLFNAVLEALVLGDLTGLVDSSESTRECPWSLETCLSKKYLDDVEKSQSFSMHLKEFFMPCLDDR